MPRRYPWESTTQSTPLSKLKYSSPHMNVVASTPMTTTTKTITINPYKRVIAPFVVTTPTLPKYTQTTVDSLCIDRYKTRYNDNSSSNNTSCNKGGNVSTTTKRSLNPFNSRYTGNTVAKITASPFKYKNTVNVMSLSTTTKGYQKSLRNVGRGKRILNQCICISFASRLSFPHSGRVSLILHGLSHVIGDYLYVFASHSSTHFPNLRRRNFVTEERFSRDIEKCAVFYISWPPRLLSALRCYPITKYLEKPFFVLFV